MKKCFLIIILVLIHFNRIYAQTNKIIHLSYNTGSQFKVRKYIENNIIHFYIENEHFKTKEKSKIFKDKLNNINLININQFIDISKKERLKLIKEGESKGVIKILKNSKTFKTIYLYEKKGCYVYRYDVKWVDEIIN